MKNGNYRRKREGGAMEVEFKLVMMCAAGLERGEAGRRGRRRYQARLVRAGKVTSLPEHGKDFKVEVLPEALRRATEGGLFDQKAVFVDHAGQWENPSLEKIVGVTSRAVFDGSAVNGEIEMYDTPYAQAITRLIDEILEEGSQSPDVGLSIVFYPVWGEGQTIVDIRRVESVDLVFQPAAHGRILAALSQSHLGATSPLWPKQFLDETIPTYDKENNPMEEDRLENRSTRSGLIPMDPPSAAAVEPGPDDRLESEAGPGQREAASGASWLKAISTTGTEVLLAASGLPQAARARLATLPYSHPEQVQEAIESERKYLAQLAAGQVVQMGGAPPRSPHISGMRSDLDRVNLAMEALFAGLRPPDDIQPLTGIREAYHLLTGDYEMSGLYHAERVYFANANSSTMASLVANALNKRLVSEFAEYPQWWAPIVVAEDFNNLQDVRWVTLGGIGELPTVAEGAAYTELTWDDKTETASFIKKGGYLGIPLETIDKDDVGRLRAAPRALAQAAWLTMGKVISSIFTSNNGAGPTMSDGLALFHTNHSNLGTSALNRPSYVAARLAMRKQTELNSGERLGALTAPRYLLVPPDLEITALEVLASENDFTYSLSNGTAAPANVLTEGNSFEARMSFARNRVIVNDLWTATTAWACVADPRLYPGIGLGFRYGRIPEIFSVASPTSGLIFTNDTLPVKVRFVIAAGPMDWKGLYKANV
jgi:hypothetical protein